MEKLKVKIALKLEKLHLLGAGFSRILTYISESIQSLSPCYFMSHRTRDLGHINCWNDIFPFTFFLVNFYSAWVNTTAPNSSCLVPSIRYLHRSITTSPTHYILWRQLSIESKNMFSLFGDTVAASQNSETKVISTPYRNKSLTKFSCISFHSAPLYKKSRWWKLSEETTCIFSHPHHNSGLITGVSIIMDFSHLFSFCSWEDFKLWQ